MKKRIATRTMAFFLALVSMVCFVTIPAAASVIEGGHEIKVVVLDPGHGGPGEGASYTYMGKTYDEQELNLKIAQYCRDYLEENYWNVKVLMTREGPAKVGLKERVQFAVDNNADFLLSIHLNGFNGRKRGSYALVPMGVYNPEQAAVSRAVGAEIQKELEKLGVQNDGFLEKTKTSERYPDGTPKDSYKIVRYGVEMNVPAIIIENCYIDNYQDFDAFLSSEEKLENLGIANAKGLATVLGLEDISQKPFNFNSAEENGDAPFKDVFENQWFYDDVIYVYDNGLMQGMAENTFAPAEPTTRAMVVTLLYRMERTQEKAVQVTFSDVAPGAWYYDEVEWAYANGVTTGISDGVFAPDQNVTREQFMTFMYRYAQERGYQVQSDQDLSDFTDRNHISDFAVAAMKWAVENELIKGYDDGSIQPKRELNRSELAALMHRFDEYLLTEGPAEPDEPEEPSEPSEEEPSEPSEEEPSEPSEEEPSEPSEEEPSEPSEEEPSEPSEEEPSEPSEEEPSEPSEEEPSEPSEEEPSEPSGEEPSEPSEEEPSEPSEEEPSELSEEDPAEPFADDRMGVQN